MAQIPRYFDSAPQFFFWEVDEVIVFSICFGVGILVDRLLTFAIIGIVLMKAVAKMKAGKIDGYFLHYAYWRVGLKLRGRSFLKNYERTLME